MKNRGKESFTDGILLKGKRLTVKKFAPKASLWQTKKHKQKKHFRFKIAEGFEVGPEVISFIGAEIFCQNE
jgi:hypothetical protein